MATAGAYTYHLLATTSVMHEMRHAASSSASHVRHSSIPSSASLATRIPHQRLLGLGVAHAQLSDEDDSITSAEEGLEPLDSSAGPRRSQDDTQLLEDARDATRMGERMSREQYAALKRKIGGTYKDFFKDSIEVEGDFVDEGWVDKSCRFCKKDTASEPRTVDKYGRYAHVACLEKSAKSGNFFSRLLGM